MSSPSTHSHSEDAAQQNPQRSSATTWATPPFHSESHQFHTYVSPTLSLINTKNVKHPDELFGVEWDIEKYKKMSREEQIQYKAFLAEKSKEKMKENTKKMEGILKNSRKPQLGVDQPRSATYTRLKELEKECLQMTKNRHAAQVAVEEVLRNPGKKTDELSAIMEPMRALVLNEHGAGLLATLDDTFHREAIKEGEINSSANVGGEYFSTGQGLSPVFGIPSCQGTSVSTLVPDDLDVGRKHPETKLSLRFNTGPSEGGNAHSDELTEKYMLQRFELRGEWKQFNEHTLRLSPEEQSNPEISIYIGWNLVEQGYAMKALDVLDNSWRRWKLRLTFADLGIPSKGHTTNPFSVSGRFRQPWKPDSGKKALREALQFMRAYCRILCQCKVKDIFEEAWPARTFDDSSATISYLSEFQAVAEYWYHKIIQCAWKEGLLDEETSKLRVQRHLQAITEFLYTNGRVAEAIQFHLLSCAYPDTEKERLACLQEIIKFSTTDPIASARFLLKLPNPFDAKYLDIYLTALGRAEEFLSDDDSSSGLLELKLFNLQYAHNPTSTQLLELSELCFSFENIDFPGGELRARSERISVASKVNPSNDFAFRCHEDFAGTISARNNQLRQLEVDLKFYSELLSNPAHIGKAVKGLHHCFIKTAGQMPASYGRAGILLSRAYLKIGDREKSLMYSNLARECLKHTQNFELLSDATSQLAEALIAGNVLLDLMDARVLLDSSLNIDYDRHYLDGMVKKTHLARCVEEKIHDLNADDNDKFHQYQSRLPHRKFRKEAIGVKMSYSKTMETVGVCLTNNDIEQAEKLVMEALGKRSAEESTKEAPEWQQMLFWIFYHRLDSPSQPEEQRADHIKMIRSQAEITIKAYEQLGVYSVPVPFIIEISEVFQKLVQCNRSLKAQLFEEALGYLDKAERICESMRRGFSSSSGLESLIEKRLVVSYKWHQKIYANALAMALALDDAEKVWLWTQKFKARALSDMLASRMELSEQLQAGPFAGDDAKPSTRIRGQLPNRFVELMHAETPSQEGSGKYNADGKNQSVLSDVLGAPGWDVDKNRLRAVFEPSKSHGLASNTQIVLIDWVVVEDTILMLTMDKTMVPTLTRLDITLTQILFWRWNNLEEREEPLSKPGDLKKRDLLNGLISGLERNTGPGDLLVLCPSSALYGIPIHALKIEDKVLIERNFVVYTPSLRVLLQCFEKVTANVARRSGEPQAAFIAAFEEEKYRLERDEIFASVKKIAADFGAEPKLGPEANRASFTDIAQSSGILHYHGHMTSHNNIMYHALVLSDGRRLPMRDGRQALPSTVQEIRDHQDRLTVRDVFSLRINASLVSLIACGSGVQDMAPGDEPLGLLSALFYAGAATTVSTLWPVKSAKGRVFAAIFFGKLRSQLETGKEHVLSPVNLAVSFTEAVRELRKSVGVAYLYHWAGYVMHGAWLF